MSTTAHTLAPDSVRTLWAGRPWAAARPLSTADVRRFLDQVMATTGAGLSDPGRIDLIAALEDLKGAAAAAQARVQEEFDASQRADAAAAGVSASKRGLGVGEQVALARRESPHKASRLMGLAKALVQEMPHTMEALSRGQISEWRATILVRETAVLTKDERAAVDRRLAPRLGDLSDRQLGAAARAAAYELDPTTVQRRGRHAASERYVALAPAPDTMARLTAYVPVAQGVAMYAALTADAAAKRGAGDSRSRAQIMADTLVQRVTGQTTADAVPIEVHLVMTDRTLFSGDSTPAEVPGYGPIPAQNARDLIHEALATPDADAGRVWVRRLIADPITGAVRTVDATRRLFTGSARRFITTRDQGCRTPYCGAQIRHIDHIRPVSRGGPTTALNGQGLCERCNHAKEAPGWHVTPTLDDQCRHTTITTTPTGHVYFSTAPPALLTLEDTGDTEDHPSESPRDRAPLLA